jgi:hypothetical protein
MQKELQQSTAYHSTPVKLPKDFKQHKGRISQGWYLLIHKVAGQMIAGHALYQHW